MEGVRLRIIRRTLHGCAVVLSLCAALLFHEVQAEPPWPPARAPVAATAAPGAAPSVSPSPPPSIAPVTSPSPAPLASPNSTTGAGVLDPSQVLALQSLGLAAGPDTCTIAQPTQIRCDTASPLRHVTLLGLQYCAPTTTLSSAAFANLSTLTSLSFLDCPVPIVPWSPALALSLTSFTAAASLGRTPEHPELAPLPGSWLAQLNNLQQLTVLDIDVNSTSVNAILSNMTSLTELTIRNAALTSSLPSTWRAVNLTTLDLSNNRLAGALPSLSSLAQLTQLNLALNSLSGTIPSSLGELKNLNKLQLNHNRLSGALPPSLANLSSLVYLDLSNNGFNGSVPGYLGELFALRYLDLSNNTFQGAIPFTPLFLSRLNTFSVTGNPLLCFNASVVAGKLAGGLPPCEANGLPGVVAPDAGFGPASPPRAQPGHVAPAQGHHKGPATLVWAAGIGVGVVVFLIIAIVVVSRCCNSSKD